jgi:precorrin-6B methylase 2
MGSDTPVVALQGLRPLLRPIWHAARRGAMLTAWRVQDWRYGIDTYIAGGFGKPVFEDDAGYEPLSYRSIRRLRDALSPVPEDVLFDVGCGKGRIVCSFARHPIRRCVGIERVPAYAAAARCNAQRLRGRRAPIEIREGDAATADYTEATIILLFNPFGPDTMRRLIERIRCSLDNKPRRLRIVYVNARFENVFEEAGWLRPVRALSLPYRGKWRMKASIWEHAESASRDLFAITQK